MRKFLQTKVAQAGLPFVLSRINILQPQDSHACSDVYKTDGNRYTLRKNVDKLFERTDQQSSLLSIVFSANGALSSSSVRQPSNFDLLANMRSYHTCLTSGTFKYYKHCLTAGFIGGKHSIQQDVYLNTFYSHCQGQQHRGK